MSSHPSENSGVGICEIRKTVGRKASNRKCKAAFVRMRSSKKEPSLALSLYRTKLGASRNDPVKPPVRNRAGVGYQNSGESKLRVFRITASRVRRALF